MRVTAIAGRVARVASGGVEIDAGLDLVDDVEVGDYLIVHAGYAIQRLSAAEAQETLSILERLNESWQD
jgi:hydrogenase expression/formation protein HypC